jgi:hypothetical protein
MAVKNIAVTDTLETFRTTFNDLAANDFGDIANLSGSISATNLVDAMNETISIATSTAGWTIEDSTSTQQIIGGGDVLRVFGTSNEIEAVVSATDTLTIGLPSAVTITTSLTTPTINAGSLQLSGNTITATDSTAISFGSENLITTGTLNAGAITVTSITGSGATHTLGTVEISGNTLRSTDSTRLNINDSFRANAFETQTGLLTVNEIGGFPYLTSSASGGAITAALAIDANLYIAQNRTIIYEGSTSDSNRTTLTVSDPTGTNTITIPDNTGTIVTTGSIDAITESMIASDAIGQNELKSLVTLQILNSSGTTLKTIYGAGA